MPEPPHPRARAIVILPVAHRPGPMPWTPAVRVGGFTAVWIARTPVPAPVLGRPGVPGRPRVPGGPGADVTLLRFDQRLATLALHAGGTQPGGFGWRYGPLIRPAERRHLLAAFNSGFQESYGAGGFVQDGKLGWALKRGEASAVTYRDGVTDIGYWRRTVPAAGRPVASVRQNLRRLLVDRGRIPASVDTCIRACWGDPLHELPLTARSALAVDSGGDLIWAGGLRLSVRALAEALNTHGATRALELDINPAWVAGFLYAHARHHNAVAPVALVPGQVEVDGAFLQPYWRDFFTVLARSSGSR